LSIFELLNLRESSQKPFATCGSLILLKSLKNINGFCMESHGRKNPL